MPEDRSLSNDLLHLNTDVERIDYLFAAMRKVLVDRSASYSSTASAFSNIRASSRIDIPPHVACFIRMMDKFSRLENLIRADTTTAIDGERLADTALDLANYALIMIVLATMPTEDQTHRRRRRASDWVMRVGDTAAPESSSEGTAARPPTPIPPPTTGSGCESNDGRPRTFEDDPPVLSDPH